MGAPTSKREEAWRKREELKGRLDEELKGKTAKERDKERKRKLRAKATTSARASASEVRSAMESGGGRVVPDGGKLPREFGEQVLLDIEAADDDTVVSTTVRLLKL